MKTESIPRELLDQGKIYMASRYHNAKRIVREPFLLHTIVDNHVSGIWLLDNVPGSAFNNLTKFDHKWVDRKIKKLDDESNTLANQRHNLSNINLKLVA